MTNTSSNPNNTAEAAPVEATNANVEWNQKVREAKLQNETTRKNRLTQPSDETATSAVTEATSTEGAVQPETNDITDTDFPEYDSDHDSVGDSDEDGSVDENASKTDSFSIDDETSAPARSQFNPLDAAFNHALSNHVSFAPNTTTVATTAATDVTSSNHANDPFDFPPLSESSTSTTTVATTPATSTSWASRLKSTEPVIRTSQVVTSPICTVTTAATNDTPVPTSTNATLVQKSNTSTTTATTITTPSIKTAPKQKAMSMNASNSNRPMQQTHALANESRQLAAADDGLGWINPTNISSIKANNNIDFFTGKSSSTAVITTVDPNTRASTANDGTNKKHSKHKRNKNRRNDSNNSGRYTTNSGEISCVTTDFSMQNVLLQMGLSVMSVDGLLVTQVKQFVLRCMACYQLHYDMNRLFCKRCGVNHMSRVAVSINASTGQLKLHLKQNYKVNTKGMKYSIKQPLQTNNRYQGDILLREDQLLSGIWRQKVVKINKDVKSMFGDEVTNDIGLQVNKSSAIAVGFGRRNPNALKGRERRGKAKK